MDVRVFQGVRDGHWDMAMVTSLVIHLLVFFYFSSTASKSIPDHGVRLDITLQPWVPVVAAIEPIPIPIPVTPPHERPDDPVQNPVESVVVEQQSVPKEPLYLDKPELVEPSSPVDQQPWMPAPEVFAEPVVEQTDMVPVLTTMEPVVEVDDASQIDIREGVRNAYLDSILRIIKSAKYYPRSARKRGYEDVVKVSFRLMEDGSIKDLLVNGRYSVLRSAAGDAVIQSCPFPIPPVSIDVPVLINYSMVFELN